MAKNEGYWSLQIYKLAKEDSDSGKSFLNLYKKIKTTEESWSRKTTTICLKYDEKREINLDNVEITILSKLFGTDKFNITISWNDSYLEFCIIFTDVQFPNF